MRRMHMSGCVAGTPLSSGLGRFMLPCLNRRACLATISARLSREPLAFARIIAAVGLFAPLSPGVPLLRRAVTSRATAILSSTYSHKCHYFTLQSACMLSAIHTECRKHLGAAVSKFLGLHVAKMH